MCCDILGQGKLHCRELSFLYLTQGHYIGYAGMEIGSIQVLHCISTAFQSGLTQCNISSNVI